MNLELKQYDPVTQTSKVLVIKN